MRVRRKAGSLVPLELAICTAALALRDHGVEQFHGYLIAKELKDAADTKLLTAYGTLYRALGRLEQMGLMTSTWEDPQIPADENRPRRRLLHHYSRRARGSGQHRWRISGAAGGAASVHDMNPRERANAAARVTRWWTRCYTAGLPGDVRDARRAEIESDLWDSLADGNSTRHILARLALGIPDDLTWSLTLMDTNTRAVTGWSLGSLSLFVLASLWLSLAPQSVVMRESMWAFPMALSVHLLGLVLLVGMRLAIDLRLTGWAFGGVPASQLVNRAAPWSVVGAIVTVASGMALYAADAARVGANPAFQLKVIALALVLANVWFFHVVLSRDMRDWDTAAAPPRAVRASAWLSLALWASILVAGKLVQFISVY